MKIPSFLKHAVEGGKKKNVGVEKFQPKSMQELKKRAMRVLVLRYKKITAEAEKRKSENIKEALKMLDEAEKIIEKLEELKETKTKDLVIDDLEQIVGSQFIEDTSKITQIKEKNPEGQEIKFELKEQAEYWNQFYEENGVNWTEPIPEDISVTAEQETEMKRLIKEYGFDKMIIIPAGLVGEPEIEEYIDEEGETKKKLKKPAENYEELNKLMSAGYNESFQSDNYKEDGGLGASLDTRQGLRIILTKEVQEIEDDDLLDQTIGKSVEDLELGIFNETGLGGLTESEYLVYQFEYYKKTGKHLDEKNWTWLPASRRLVSGRVPCSFWSPVNSQLYFCSYPGDCRYDDLGCRFVGSFSIVI